MDQNERASDEASLVGKTVLITGAARRLGAATVRAAHAAGANVVIHHRRSGEEALHLATALERQRAGSTLVVEAELADIGMLPAMVNRVLERFGRLDALVNNASSFFPTPIGSITEAQWDDLMGSNLKAPLFLSQAAAPFLHETRGAIVNITDIHADRPFAEFPVYCAAKAGLAGLTRALAIELAPHVRVNGVAPGPIEWPADVVFAEAERARIIGDTLLKRCGSPQDIARAVIFMLTGGPYITGQILSVDGGRSVHL